MSEAFDANVVLRHFTGQPPAMAARATTALVEAPPRSLVLTDLTVAEVVYVLQGPYAWARWLSTTKPSSAARWSTTGSEAWTGPMRTWSRWWSCATWTGCLALTVSTPRSQGLP